MTVREALSAAAMRFRAAGSDTPELDAELLLGLVLERDRAGVVARRSEQLSSHHEASFESLVARRVHREPIAYLLGRREFYSLSFAVDTRALTPRPETELLVEEALTVIDAGARRVADVGTGTGAIAVALLHERGTLPDLDLVAVDFSRDALGLATQNARRLLPVEAQPDFVRADLLEALGDRSLDLVVSNPPYLSAAELTQAPPELLFEPTLALAGGDLDGLGVVRRLVGAAWRTLREGGTMLVEISPSQGAKVARLVEERGFYEVATVADLEGRDRLVRALKPAR